MNVREATHDDIDILNRFQKDLIEYERPMAAPLKDDAMYYDIGELIEDEKSVVVVIDQDSKPVASGYGQIRKNSNYFVDEFYGYIGFMFVEPELRGKGLSKQILEALLDWFKQRNIIDIRLQVYSENESAVKAYERGQFKAHLTEMRYVIK